MTSQDSPCVPEEPPPLLKTAYLPILFKLLGAGLHQLSKFTSVKTLFFFKLCCSGGPLMTLFVYNFFFKSLFSFFFSNSVFSYQKTLILLSCSFHLIGFHSRTFSRSLSNITSPTFGFLPMWVSVWPIIRASSRSGKNSLVEFKITLRKSNGINLPRLARRSPVLGSFLGVGCWAGR
jgi:hypothetical protein